MESSVDIKSFLKKLINKTQMHECQWEELKNGIFRLLLRNGSVVLDTTGSGSTYELRLYDESECFAFYSSDIFVDTSGVSSLLEILNKAILEYRNSLIERKISKLYDDLI